MNTNELIELDKLRTNKDAHEKELAAERENSAPSMLLPSACRQAWRENTQLAARVKDLEEVIADFESPAVLEIIKFMQHSKHESAVLTYQQHTVTTIPWKVQLSGFLKIIAEMYDDDRGGSRVLDLRGLAVYAFLLFEKAFDPSTNKARTSR